MSVAKEILFSRLGFRFGTNGPHAARTMMLDDLRILFARLPVDATRADYAEDVVARNALGKPTKKARELTLRHLTALYGLDPKLPLFRALRRIWGSDEAAQPMLALTVALARDPLLRSTQPFILSKAPGALVAREDIENLFAANHQDRFSPASLKSFAQNVNGTWTAAGFLSGRIRKTRSVPVVTPTNVALCLFLGYLEGLSGQRLFTSPWMGLLAGSSGELEGLVSSASHRGLLVFMNAGGVKELRFPDYLTVEEEQVRQEASSVI
ncbi:hypothetical protein [Janthinobacterium sp. UMAB-60]|uniref:hypothetical protein n=1 Tax=Janthinobacterium sp. UMAB-60 TaxID=1365365 RepID=UPI00214C35EB|nr:hypothetical protein [Janthinobacterium sp. UMAB-60]